MGRSKGCMCTAFKPQTVAHMIDKEELEGRRDKGNFLTLPSGWENIVSLQASALLFSPTKKKSHN